MADLEAVLADVSYLMAMERSKAPAAKTIKKVTLPDASIHNVVHLHFQQEGTYLFEKIHSQRMGAYYLGKFVGDKCNIYEFLSAILMFEGIAAHEQRRKRAKEIYDKFIFADRLAMSSTMPEEIAQMLSDALRESEAPTSVFSAVKRHLYQHLNEKYMDGFSKSQEYVRFCQWKYLELLTPYLISLHDFSIHRIIGRGGFGEVYGCRKDDSGKMLAMKLLDKKRIKVKKGEYLAVNERNMLAKVNSPFVVNLYYAFQTPEKLCFILDLMNGGDLHYHLTQHGVFSENEVRFYAAELVLGLEHIHRQNIVYRDLKPSNILLDEQGHIRISDLGLACEFTKHQPSSSVGTHGYMAPEVIKKGVQYTFTADWFSLGCVLYKLLKGHSPFRSSNAKSKEEIDHQTLNKEVQMSASFSPELSQLLTGLLQKDPGQRLGCRGRGSEEVKECSFFANTNWDDVLARKEVSKFISYPSISQQHARALAREGIIPNAKKTPLSFCSGTEISHLIMYVGAYQCLPTMLEPPLEPPRGEVNAADAFDIGSFDEDDTKKIRLSDTDQRIYKNFNLVVQDRWQEEMMEGIFASVNSERDRLEERERQKCHRAGVDYYNPDLHHRDSLIQGYGHKLGGMSLLPQWQKKFFVLYPNRLEWSDNIISIGKANVLAFDSSVLVEEKENRGLNCIRVQPVGSKKEYWLRFESALEHEIWLDYLKQSVIKSEALLTAGPKMMRDGSSLSSLLHPRRQPLHVAKSLPLSDGKST